MCDYCRKKPVEWLPFADPYQHETTRSHQNLTVEAASMQIHVAERHGLSWSTMRRIEEQAIIR